MPFFNDKAIKILGGIFLIFLVLGVGIEILAGTFVGFSPFVEPLTALDRVGTYTAPYEEVEFYPENLMTDFAVQNGKLYISDFSSHLRVIDVSNPANPKEVAVLPLEYQPRIAALTTEYLFLTRFPHLESDEKPEGKTDQIEIFDISNLKKVEKVGEYTPQCESFCLIFDSALVVDDTLYLPITERPFNGTAEKITIHVLDITNPSSVLKRTEIEIPREQPSEIRELQLQGSREYVGVVEEDRFHLFSQENAETYELASTYVLPQENRYTCRYFNDIAIREKVAYLLEQYGASSGCGRAALRIFDISNPVSPRELGKFEFPYNAGEIEVKGDYIFVGNRARGMRVLDVSDPAAPKEIAHYTSFLTPLYQEIWQMEIDEEYAYVVGHQVLGDLKRIDIIDISSL